MLCFNLLAHNGKQFLHKRRQKLIFVKEIRKSVDDFIRDELRPLLFEFGRQAERAARIILVRCMLSDQLPHIFHLVLEAPVRRLRFEQVAFDHLAALTLLPEGRLNLMCRHFCEVWQVHLNLN